MSIYSRVNRSKVTTIQSMANHLKRGQLAPQIAGRQHNIILETRMRETLAERWAAAPQEIRGIPQHLWDVVPDEKAVEGTPEAELHALFVERAKYVEMGNRLPNGSVDLLSPTDYYSMTPNAIGAKNAAGVLINNPRELMQLFHEGVAIIKSNNVMPELSTVFRGVPVGGASTRAAKALATNPGMASEMAIDPGTPRFLYPVMAGANKGKFLLHVLLENNRELHKLLDRVSPNVFITRSELAEVLTNALVKSITASWTRKERANSFLFNVDTVRRFLLEAPHEFVGDKQYPTGHGAYPKLANEYKIFDALLQAGLKTLIFSNGDEFLWGPDPVMIAIAHRYYAQGYGGLIGVVPNPQQQAGGGAVKDANGQKRLVETPRLPWSIMQSGQYPSRINTAFYAFSLENLVRNSGVLSGLAHSLAVKTENNVAGRKIVQTGATDSWAGDILSAAGNMIFVDLPRNNFLGFKTPEHVVGTENKDYLDGLSHKQFAGRAAEAFMKTMRGLIKGDMSVAENLFRSNYTYIEV